MFRSYLLRLGALLSLLVLARLADHAQQLGTVEADFSQPLDPPAYVPVRLRPAATPPRPPAALASYLLLSRSAR